MKIAIAILVGWLVLLTVYTVTVRMQANTNTGLIYQNTALINKNINIIEGVVGLLEKIARQMTKTSTVEIVVECAYNEENRIYGYKLVEVKEVK